MITGPMFRQFGSKWMGSRMAPPPKYATIIEPFAGGAGYSLRHYKNNVILWDTDKQLQSLWSWLFVSDPKEILAIPVGLPAGTDIRNIGLSTGQQLLLKFWQRTNNVGNCWTISKWGSRPGFWCASARERVARQVEMIRHWRLQEPDYNETACWYVDPPYQFNYKYRQQVISYTGLAERVRALRGQVIVCEAYGTNGEKPTWLPFRESHFQITSRRRKTDTKKIIHSRELIWTNEAPSPEP